MNELKHDEEVNIINNDVLKIYSMQKQLIKLIEFNFIYSFEKCIGFFLFYSWFQ